MARSLNPTSPPFLVYIEYIYEAEAHITYMSTRKEARTEFLRGIGILGAHRFSCHLTLCGKFIQALLSTT